jgi:hypothetical protein
MGEKEDLMYQSELISFIHLLAPLKVSKSAGCDGPGCPAATPAATAPE